MILIVSPGIGVKGLQFDFEDKNSFSIQKVDLGLIKPIADYISIEISLLGIEFVGFEGAQRFNGDITAFTYVE